MKLLTALSLLVLQADSTPPRAAPADDPTRVAVSGPFVLHSSPWLNLHHFLFQWARAETPAQPGDRRRPVRVTETLESLTPEERADWSAAVAHYSEHVVARYLLFNTPLVELKSRLYAAGDAAPEDLPKDLPYDLHAPLTAAYPIYRRAFWPAHDAGNRAWVREVLPKVRAHGEYASEAIATAMGGHWPNDPMRVDLVHYANWAGAYTTQQPDHVVISTSDPENQGWGAFETLIHEPCHTEAVSQNLGELIHTAFQAAGQTEPERLWHALIFYTAGHLTREITSVEGLPQYATYAEKAGFWRRGDWRGYDVLLDRHWQPYLLGEVERRASLEALARDLFD